MTKKLQLQIGPQNNFISDTDPFPVKTIVTSAIPFRRLATADTNLAVVKASAGNIFSLYLQNLSASAKYLKIYDKATNAVLATDVPKVTIAVGANGAVNPIFAGTNGISFANGIVIATTGGIADTDTTALVANDTILTIVYN